MDRREGSHAHNRVVYGEGEAGLKHEDENECVDVVARLAFSAESLSDGHVAVVLFSVTYTDVPCEADGPDSQAGVDGPGTCVNGLAKGELGAKNTSVREQEGQTPNDIDVTVIFLKLAVGEAGCLRCHH